EAVQEDQQRILLRRAVAGREILVVALLGRRGAERALHLPRAARRLRGGGRSGDGEEIGRFFFGLGVHLVGDARSVFDRVFVCNPVVFEGFVDFDIGDFVFARRL